MSTLTLWPAVLLCTALGCSRGEAAPKSGGPSTTATTSASISSVTTATQGADPRTQAADRGRVLGAESALVWLLIVSDFQCPWCKMWHDSTFPAIKREYVDAGKVRIAYLNFPLGIHANAWPSAMTAMCASAQGKFWETQDRLFETQKRWEKLADSRPFLDSLAIASGVDPIQLRECTSKSALQDLIASDQTRANKAGAETTPTFFIGGAKIEGAQPITLFRHVIDSVLAAVAKGK